MYSGKIIYIRAVPVLEFRQEIPILTVGHDRISPTMENMQYQEALLEDMDKQQGVFRFLKSVPRPPLEPHSVAADRIMSALTEFQTCAAL